jgi:1-acyl-sn-glycerol-3-phosphate acyltransferase
VILAPNHVAVMDPPYLSLITRRQLRMMAKEELFRPRVVGRYLHALGAFPVRRGTADRAALRQAVELLKQGHLVGIFPEGTRSDGTFLRPAEKGFALIARQTGAPIVPVAIEGTERILPRGSKRPHRGRVQISIGRPFTAQEVLAQSEAQGRDALTAIGEATIAAIAGLMSAPRPIMEAPEKSLEKSSAGP